MNDKALDGYWAPTKSGYLTCSECGDCYIAAEWLLDGKWNFCPNCGVKMRKLEMEEDLGGE